MGNIFNSDFRDFIQALNDASVDYLLIGGYSVILHGYARTTGDLDIWVENSEENYNKLEKAFQIFGMPMFDLTLSKFRDTKNYDVFTFGRSPVSIEILTVVKGLNFNEAFEDSIIFDDDDVKVRCIQYHHLIASKKAAGRNRDLNDIEQLRKSKGN